jgi:2'-5' RNA ligase
LSEFEDSKVRLFFAVMPDPETRERIAAAAISMRLDSDARLVPPHNYHMTLAFIGEVPARQVPTLQRIGAAQRMAPCSLRIDAYEFWPKPKVVVGATQTLPAALERLWRQLHRDLAEHQWALDPQQLRPHVTLARKVSQAPVLQAMSAFDWLVRDFSLVRSDTGGIQSAYTVLDTWSLLDDSGNA